MSDLNEMYKEATALKDKGDMEGATAKLEEIVAIDSTYAVAHSALAVYYQQMGRAREAIAHAETVVELQPKDPFSYTQLSVICQRCGRIQEAEEAMARSRQMQFGSQ